MWEKSFSQKDSRRPPLLLLECSLPDRTFLNIRSFVMFHWNSNIGLKTFGSISLFFSFQKESRTNRVDSWRTFQAGGKKKKEKKGRTAFKPPALRPEKRWASERDTSCHSFQSTEANCMTSAHNVLESLCACGKAKCSTRLLCKL